MLHMSNLNTFAISLSVFTLFFLATVSVKMTKFSPCVRDKKDDCVERRWIYFRTSLSPSFTRSKRIIDSNSIRSFTTQDRWIQQNDRKATPLTMYSTPPIKQINQWRPFAMLPSTQKNDFWRWEGLMLKETPRRRWCTIGVRKNSVSRRRILTYSVYTWAMETLYIRNMRDCKRTERFCELTVEVFIGIT